MHARNLGIPEIILIIVVAVLVFGPGRIAKLGGELGKAIQGFRKETQADRKSE